VVPTTAVGIVAGTGIRGAATNVSASSATGTAVSVLCGYSPTLVQRSAQPRCAAVVTSATVTNGTSDAAAGGGCMLVQSLLPVAGSLVATLDTITLRRCTAAGGPGGALRIDAGSRNDGLVTATATRLRVEDSESTAGDGGGSVCRGGRAD
jgi:hypothetical protein